MKAFPKIFQLDSRYVDGILDNEVEITEKVDGSQIIISKIDGVLSIRSKGADIYKEDCPNLFKPAVQHILSIQASLPDNIILYGETLCKPRHNVLNYDKVPKNHIVLFGAMDLSKNMKDREYLRSIAEKIDVDIIPILYQGNITRDEIDKLLENISYLGRNKIEGVVVKNYQKQAMVGGIILPLMSGKLVSKEFQEVHQRDWKKENTSKGKWQTFCEGFKSEARWRKAVQHLRDKDELENDPADIGKLMKEINKDIEEEEKETIKDFLYKEFKNDVLSSAKIGFAEWYKNYLKGEIKQNGD